LVFEIVLYLCVFLKWPRRTPYGGQNAAISSAGAGSGEVEPWWLTFLRASGQRIWAAIRQAGSSNVFSVVWLICVVAVFASMIYAAKSIQDEEAFRWVIGLGCTFLAGCEGYHVFAFYQSWNHHVDLGKDLFLVAIDHVAIAMVAVLTAQAGPKESLWPRLAWLRRSPLQFVDRAVAK
jgi:hypothetical protein